MSVTDQPLPGVLSVVAGPGVSNTMFVEPADPDLYTVTELSGTLRAGSGCGYLRGDPTKVICLGVGVSSLRVHAGDMNDVVVNDTSLRSELRGGPGVDRLEGGSDSDTLRGDEDDDHLFGRAGPDTLEGGPGTDVCDVGADGGTTLDCES